MFTWLKRLWEKVFGTESSPTDDYNDRRRDNLPTAPIPPLPDNDENEKEDEILLWYPKRVTDSSVKDLKMKTRGYYQKGHPEGAIVHFTAGRSRKKSDGGSRNASTHLEQGIRGVKNAVDQGSYAYFVIDRDGHVFQQFPLNRWGYHAGKSKCPKTGRTSVSSYYVGIEVQNAGRLKKIDGERFLAWFSKPENGDEYFYASKGEVKYFNKKENIQAGYYHLYSSEQKAALVDLLIWLEENGNGIFSLDKVFGHDEVAPERKSDPGGSLDMTMEEFRNMIRDIKYYEEQNPGKIPEKKPLLNRLAESYKKQNIEFPQLKAVTLAQWMLESGRATSELSVKYNNFGGLKWRDEMKDIGATSVPYKAHDGLTDYCKFDTINHYIEGYWRFLERSPYKGWKDHVSTGEEFLEYIVKCGYCPDQDYVKKVLKLVPEALKLLS